MSKSNFDNPNARAMMIHAVRVFCSECPTALPEIIAAATEGVNAFATSQEDRVTRMSYQLCEVLDNTAAKNLKTGNFKISDILNTQRNIIGGTPCMEKLMKKYGVTQEELDAAHERNKWRGDGE